MAGAQSGALGALFPRHVSGDRLDILVVAPNPDSSFVEADVAGLRHQFTVERIAYRDVQGKLAFLRTVLASLRSRRPRVVLLWFLAPSYALETMAMARLFGCRLVLVVGGLEVDYVPDLGLGGLRWPHNRLRQRIGLRLPDLVLSPSRFLAEKIERLSRPRRLEVVANGIDTAYFGPGGRDKERLVTTVCFEVTRETAPLKGLPVLLDAAAQLPDARFAIVGRPGADDEYARLEARASPNVEFTGRVSDEELLELYRRSKVYAQISAHEAFGVAVVEAMACECVPVVSDRGSLPEVAGDTGSFVPYGDAQETVRAISAALSLPRSRGEAGRQRVLGHYTIERRMSRLVALLGPLVAEGRS